MDRMGVKAILEVPIFVNNQEWGAIGFDDFEQERVVEQCRNGRAENCLGRARGRDPASESRFSCPGV